MGIGWDKNADVDGYNNSSHIVTYLSHRYAEALKMVYAPTETDTIAAERDAQSDPNYPNSGPNVPEIQGDAGGYLRRGSDNAGVPDLSTTNAARAKIMRTNLDAFQRISDLAALDRTEFQNIDSDRTSLTQNKSLLDSSVSIESQLGHLLVRIGELPKQAGYPGVNGVLKGATGPITGSGQAAGTVSADVPTINSYATAAEATSGQDIQNTTPSATVRDYNSDLQAVQAIADVGTLTDYELELKRIDNTFQQLAPYIHGVDDLRKEEAVYETLNNEALNIYDPVKKSGVLADCVKRTSDTSAYAKAGGPTARVLFSYYVENGTRIQSLPTWLTDALKPQQSFLPDWHFAQGGGLDLLSFPTYPPGNQQKTAEYKTLNYVGSAMVMRPVNLFYAGVVGSGGSSSTGQINMSDPANLVETFAPGVTVDYNKLIYNHDISTINWQPTVNALLGFEHVLGVY